ncbi:MAG: serine/threonine protein kinase [Myxococcales bacterium]|nr:serine/threonine protein kinase [Myxococcales bacterium]
MSDESGPINSANTFHAMRSGNMVLDGRYELCEYLGQGGMGQVWQARDKWLEMDVAVKLLTRQTRGFSEAHDRLRAEYKAMARLTHPNVVRTHGFGRAKIPDIQRGGEVEIDYFTMQLVPPPRHTIEDLLEQGSLPVPRAFRLARDLAEALLALEVAGIVHGDFKPSNIFVVETDEGLSALLGDLSSCRLPEQPPEPVRTGTPPYMAPELLDDALGEHPIASVTTSVDVWAFGTVLYEMLVGEALFPTSHHAPSLIDNARAVRQLMTPEHIDARVEAVDSMSRRVKDMIKRCLALEPSQRGGAEDVKAALVL